MSNRTYSALWIVAACLAFFGAAFAAPVVTIDGKPVTGDIRVTGDGIDIRVTVPAASQPAPVPTPDVTTILARHGVARVAAPDEFIDANNEVRWLSTRATKVGFVQAFDLAVGEALYVTLVVNGQSIRTYRLTDDRTGTETKLTALGDLKPGRYRLQPGVYDISKDINWTGVELNIDAGAVIRWTGKAEKSYASIIVKDSVIRGGEWKNAAYTYRAGDNVKSKIVSLFSPGDNSVFIGLKIGDDFNYAFNLNHDPNGVHIADTSVGRTLGYAAWVQGQNVVIDGLTHANSIFEHCVRVGLPKGEDLAKTPSRITIVNCTLTNLDNRATDPNDDGKGTLVIQASRDVYAANNTLRGPEGVGPLALPDGDARQTTTNVRIEGGTSTHPLEVWPGVDRVVTIGQQVQRMAPRSGDTRVIGRVESR